jgi:hypothetical protein
MTQATLVCAIQGISQAMSYLAGDNFLIKYQYQAV